MLRVACTASHRIDTVNIMSVGWISFALVILNNLWVKVFQLPLSFRVPFLALAFIKRPHALDVRYVNTRFTGLISITDVTP